MNIKEGQSWMMHDGVSVIVEEVDGGLVTYKLPGGMNVRMDCSTFEKLAAPIRPSHYNLDPEPLEVIESWGLGFSLGNVVKYLARAGRKGSAMEDLIKAQDYLARYINRARITDLTNDLANLKFDPDALIAPGPVEPATPIKPLTPIKPDDPIEPGKIWKIRGANSKCVVLSVTDGWVKVRYFDLTTGSLSEADFRDTHYLVWDSSISDRAVANAIFNKRQVVESGAPIEIIDQTSAIDILNRLSTGALTGSSLVGVWLPPTSMPSKPGLYACQCKWVDKSKFQAEFLMQLDWSGAKFSHDGLVEVLEWDSSSYRPFN